MDFRTKLKASLHQPLVLISAIILLVIAILAIGAPWIAPHDPTLVDVTNKLKPPSAEYPLGTDHLGRCELSRLLYGARVSLGTAVLVMTITMVIAIFIGTITGYRGGLVDNLFMRLCDIVLAFPSVLLALVMIGFLGQGLFNLILAMVVVQWVFYARLIRGMIMEAKQRTFVLAARMSGTSHFGIVLRHLWPTILPQLIVLASLDLGSVILSIAGMSFLGLGVQPPLAEWGAMINDGRNYLRSNPGLMIYPGVMILIVVMALNLLGDGLRDLSDPFGKKGGKRRWWRTSAKASKSF